MPDEPDYDPAAMRILEGMEPPPRRPDGHVEGLSPGARSLREEVRQGTLRRMRRALVEAEAAVQRLLDGGCQAGDPRVREAEEVRGRLVASIEEVGAPHRIVVTIAEDGRLFVEAPWSPPTRIVAIPEKRATAVGQRVAELVEEALAARARAGDGEA